MNLPGYSCGNQNSYFSPGSETASRQPGSVVHHENRSGLVADNTWNRDRALLGRGC